MNDRPANENREDWQTTQHKHGIPNKRDLIIKENLGQEINYNGNWNTNEMWHSCLSNITFCH